MGVVGESHGGVAVHRIDPISREAGEVVTRNCRANSRRGQTDPSNRSYPPVEAVCRALNVLRSVNKQHIATVNSIHAETEIPKPTVVRMLETLMDQGYVVRDNMCGGYRMTSKVTEFTNGYEGISRVIEVARPLVISLTRRIKWPIGLGVIDDDAIAIQFWTGTISPWAHTNTVLGLRPDLVTSAMGRAYLAYCPEAERERHLSRLRADTERVFGEIEEQQYRALLTKTLRDGFAVRDPRTPPFRSTTFGIPIMEGEVVSAVISISFFSSAVPPGEQLSRIVEPLLCTRASIEHALEFMSGRDGQTAHSNTVDNAVELSF